MGTIGREYIDIVNDTHLTVLNSERFRLKHRKRYARRVETSLALGPAHVEGRRSVRVEHAGRLALIGEGAVQEERAVVRAQRGPSPRSVLPGFLERGSSPCAAAGAGAGAGDTQAGGDGSGGDGNGVAAQENGSGVAAQGGGSGVAAQWGGRRDIGLGEIAQCTKVAARTDWAAGSCPGYGQIPSSSDGRGTRTKC